MSVVTITQEPNPIASVHSPMYYVFKTTYYTYDEFKYVVQVYDKDGLVAEKKLFALTDGYGRVDVSPILRSYLNPPLLYTTTGGTYSSNTIKQYDLRIGYQYSGGPTTPVTSGIKYIFDGVDINGVEYIIQNNTQNLKFLTNSPKTINTYLTDYYTLSTFNGTFNISSDLMSANYPCNCNRLTIVVHNTTGVKTYYWDNPNNTFTGSTSVMANVDKMLYTFGVGPVNLNTAVYLKDLSTGLDATQPVIHTDTTYYEVSIVAETYKFVVNHLPGRYAQDQIAFMNRFGNYSYFTFTGKTLKRTKKESATYLKNNYTNNGSTYTTSTQNRGITMFNANYINEYTFQSDWVDQPTMDFLEELFTSPSVYYLKPTGAIPVVITDTTWDNKSKRNDKVVNFTITCQEANKKRVNV